MNAFFVYALLATVLRSVTPQLTVTSQTTPNPSSNVLDDLYQRCPPGTVNEGAEVDTVLARSPLDCAARCSVTEDCVGVNVCPAALRPELAACTLLSERSSAGCEGLSGATSPDCFFMRKENVLGDTDFSQDATTTTNLQSTIWSGESVTGMASSAQVISTTTKTSAASTGSATYSECQNGGSMTDIPGSQSCQCPLQYAGEWCERYRRDCQDATMNTDGVYYIQPVSAPQAFQVYCYWYWQKTHFLSRTTQQLFNMTWETAKKGFGNTTSPDFFIGLENLHHLTSQATYHMEIKMREAFLPYIQYMAIYNQFHVQDETSSFALSYSEFWAAANIIGSVEEDAFGYSPLDFCTWDRDCYDGCAATRGMPGWYDSDCDGYSPFGEILEWPLSGGSKEMDDVQFALYRPGEFYS